MRSRSVLSLSFIAFLASCLPQPPVIQTASSADVQEMQRTAMARSMGYPTHKSAQDLEALIQQQTKDFTRGKEQADGRLESPAPFVIEGVKGTCYMVVMRLAADAHWGTGAEAGLRFDYRSPTGPGDGGPGVAGPGAVAAVGCAEASGPITLTMAPMVGGAPIGQGGFSLEVWSHVLSRAEAEHLAADKQRQIQEAEEFKAREAAKKQQRATAGCGRCEARYQGCLGAGRSDSSCRANYSSCIFEEAGADGMSACPNP
jgi:hypothetical protein